MLQSADDCDDCDDCALVAQTAEALQAVPTAAVGAYRHIGYVTRSKTEVLCQWFSEFPQTQKIILIGDSLFDTMESLQFKVSTMELSEDCSIEKDIQGKDIGEGFLATTTYVPNMQCSRLCNSTLAEGNGPATTPSSCTPFRAFSSL